MLISLTLKNFRRATNTHADFTPGLNVLRGGNEQGKTTRIEGISYALYGTAALRTSLEECVTWGEKVQSLKATLVYAAGGTTYRFERSKAGASVWRDAEQVPFVTGQREVTAFSSELLGADAKTAAMLMMASQADLRGALDQGPAAVSGLISKLADFALLDTILGRAQERLLIGSATPMHGKLSAAQEALDRLHLHAPDKDDDSLQVAVTIAHAAHSQLSSDFAAACMQSAAAQAAAQEGQKLRILAHDARRAVSEREAALLDCERDIKAALAVVDACPSAEEHAAASSRLALAQRSEELAAVFKEVGRCTRLYPASYWTGDEADFSAEVQAVAARLATVRGYIRDLVATAKHTRKQKVTGGKCPTCGHAALDVLVVKATNAALEAEALVHEAQAAQWQVQAESLSGDADDLQAVQTAALPSKNLLAMIANRDLPIEVDRTTYPPRIFWTADEPTAGDRDRARVAMSLIASAIRQAEAAGGRVEVLLKQKVTLDKALAAAVERCTACEEAAAGVDLDALAAEAARLQGGVAAGNQTIAESAKVLELAVEAVRERDRLLETHAAQVRVLEERIAETQADLQKLAFNNNLMKKLKALKPAVSDHLWNIVLTSVSTFFSQIRGEVSVVTKDSDGFKVNGRGIASLSGSTLDALAIAVRVALTRTFIPTATLLALDEPAHGADEYRTGNILGFLSSCGFTQVVLCSHDPLSESVASNVVTVGE
jgi:DNA repair exonuclease SbcCD ATPase subunit